MNAVEIEQAISGLAEQPRYRGHGASDGLGDETLKVGHK
jgi:hypothetical protein